MDLSSITPDPTALRAPSHPVRLRLLALLRFDGPATATALALRLGLNSGATSYHLRQLAAHGFVVDEPGRGTARERWWRAAHQSTRTRPTSEPDEREAADAFAQAVAVVHTEQLQRAVEELPLTPEPWRAAATLSDWRLRLTAAHAQELQRAVVDLVSGWPEDPDSADTEDYVVTVHAFPRPGSFPSPAEVEE